MKDYITTQFQNETRSYPVWMALLLLTNATMWTVTSEMLPSGILPAMSRDLAVSEGMIGALVSAWALTIAVASYPLVRTTLWVRRKLLLTLSLMLMAPANLLMAFAQNYATAFVGRVITAATHGLFWALVVAYVASIVEPDRIGRSLAIVLAGPTTASLVGLPLGTYLAGFVGWRTVFASLSVVFAITAVALWIVLPEAESDLNQDDSGGGWDHTGPLVLRVAIGGAMVLVGHFAAFTYVTSLVTDFAGMSEGAIPRILLALGVTGVLGIAVSGFVSDRYPVAAVTGAAGVIVLSLGLIRLGGGSSFVFLSGIAAWGFGIAAFPPILQARVLRVASPRLRPLAGSIVITALNLGIAAGAGFGGLILGYGLTVLLITAIVASAIGVLILSPTTLSIRAKVPMQV